MLAAPRDCISEAQAAEQTTAAKPFLARFIVAVGKFLWLLFCIAATVYLFKISYPKDSFPFSAWLALAPFTMGLLTLRRFSAVFWYSWISGTAVYAGLCYWIFVTCYIGGGLSVYLSTAAWLGLSALLAVQFLIFGISCYFLKSLKGFFPLFAACGWVVLEWSHEMLASYFLGFPWFSLAYSQWNLLPVLQTAAWCGAGGISFAVAFTGLSVGYGLMMPRVGRGIVHFLLAALAFLLLFEFGEEYLKRATPPGLLRLKTAVMQPNIDQYKKWSPEFEAEIENTIRLMAEQAATGNPLLVVWPESVTPGPLLEEPYSQWMIEVAQQTGAWQLLGSNREEQNAQYVSAFLLSPQGEPLGVYDKTYLVPFGEFIPLENTVRSLLPQVQVLGELGSFSAGKWDQPLLTLEQISIGSTICYESVFSHLWREQAHNGAHLFVNLTNDAWFFNTDAPYQHLAAAVLRAVENRRTVLRAANTGISAVISPTGEILARADLNTRAILTAEVALPLGKQISFYSRWGSWFGWLCLVLYLSSFLSALVVWRE